MRHLLGLFAIAGLLVGGCTTTYTVTPLETAGVTIDYNKGVGTLYSEGEHGAVQLAPLGLNPDGRLNLGVAAFNDGEEADNFGTENVRLSVDSIPVAIMTFEEMEQEARNAATAAMVLTALAGAVDAYAAQQNAYSTGYGRVGGTTYSYTHYSPLAAQIGTNAAANRTAAGAANIRMALDATLFQLENEVLRTTTLAPGESYGGRVMSRRVSVEDSAEAEVEVEFNGETHRFRLGLARDQH